jgi:hypothetical protein
LRAKEAPVTLEIPETPETTVLLEAAALRVMLGTLEVPVTPETVAQPETRELLEMVELLVQVAQGVA